MEEDETPLTLKNATVTEDGCERKTVKLTLATGTSTVEQYITLWKKTDRVDSRLRVIWSEKRRNLRLSLRYAGADVCTAAEPAGFTDRAESEYERPMNGWLALWGKEGGIRLASDDLFAYRYKNGDVHLTVLRNVVYGDLRTEDLYPDGDYDYLGQGLFDATVKCRFFEGAFDAEEAETSAIRDLSAPKTVLEANHEGDLPADFAAATLSGHGLIPMALKCEEDGEGAVLRVRSVAEGAEGVFRFLDRECTVTARTFAPATYLIDEDGTHRTNLLEDAIEV
jgi:alpha-mannosidase